MTAPIQITRTMLPYLVYQRPSYKGLAPEAAGSLLQMEVDKFLKTNSPWLSQLPKRPLRVLDIGAGLGFGTLAMSRQLEPTATFTILDKSRVEKKLFYGFEQEGAAYNDLSLSRDFLITNGISSERLAVVDIENDVFPPGQFDVIFSCISWGFHYPISTYINVVSEQLNPDGFLYVDLRAGSDGAEVLVQAGFREVWKKEGRKSLSAAWKRV